MLNSKIFDVISPFHVFLLLFVGSAVLLLLWCIAAGWMKFGGKLFNSSQQNARGQIALFIQNASNDEKPWARNIWKSLWSEIQEDLVKLNSQDISAEHWRLYAARFESIRIIEGYGPKRNSPRRAVQSINGFSVKTVHNLARENRHTVYEEELEPIDFIAYRFDLLQQGLAGQSSLIELFYRQEYVTEVPAIIEQLDLIDYQECKGLLLVAHQEFRDYVDTVHTHEFANELDALGHHKQGWVNTKAWDDLLVEVDILAELLYRLKFYYEENYPWAS